MRRRTRERRLTQGAALQNPRFADGGIAPIVPNLRPLVDAIVDAVEASSGDGWGLVDLAPLVGERAPLLEYVVDLEDGSELVVHVSRRRSDVQPAFVRLPAVQS